MKHTLPLLITLLLAPLADLASVATCQAAPDINNRAGAANVAPGEAKLQGRLDGGGDADVVVFYGPTDGGTTAGDWAHKIELQGVKNGAEFSATADKLIFGQTYYYRCRASNASGETWAGASAHFTTLKPRVPAPEANHRPVLPVKAGLVCWFDAAVGVTTDDQGVVQAWKDLSGHGHDGTLAAGAPLLVPNEIGGRPAIQFRTGTSACGLNLDGPFFTQQQFVVVRSPNAQWNKDGCFLGRRWRRNSSYRLSAKSTRFWGDQYPQAVSKNGRRLPEPPFDLGSITEYMILKIDVNDGDMSRNTYQIAMADQGSCDCDIAEIIGYQTALSPSDEELVGGYLAAKYGIKTDYPANVGMVSANVLTNAPATVSAPDAATLSATLNCPGSLYEVRVYWGTTDGGTDASLWENSAPVGAWTERRRDEDQPRPDRPHAGRDLLFHLPRHKRGGQPLGRQIAELPAGQCRGRFVRAGAAREAGPGLLVRCGGRSHGRRQGRGPGLERPFRQESSRGDRRRHRARPGGQPDQLEERGSIPQGLAGPRRSVLRQGALPRAAFAHGEMERRGRDSRPAQGPRIELQHLGPRHRVLAGPGAGGRFPQRNRAARPGVRLLAAGQVHDPQDRRQRPQPDRGGLRDREQRRLGRVRFRHRRDPRLRVDARAGRRGLGGRLSGGQVRHRYGLSAPAAGRREAGASRRRNGRGQVPGLAAFGLAVPADHARRRESAGHGCGRELPRARAAGPGLVPFQRGETQRRGHPLRHRSRRAAGVPDRHVGRRGGHGVHLGARAGDPGQRAAGDQDVLGPGRRQERVQRPGRLQQIQRLPERLAHERSGSGRRRHGRVDRSGHHARLGQDRLGPALLRRQGDPLRRDGSRSIPSPRVPTRPKRGSSRNGSTRPSSTGASTMP